MIVREHQDKYLNNLDIHKYCDTGEDIKKRIK